MTAATEYKNPTSMHVHGLTVLDAADGRAGCARMEVNGLMHEVKLLFFYQQGHVFFADVKSAAAWTPFENGDGSVDYLRVELGWQKVQDLERRAAGAQPSLRPGVLRPGRADGQPVRPH